MSERFYRLIVGLLLAAIAAVALYRGARSASDLSTVPDAVEYALGGHRLAFEGRYTILVAGRELPPRYPPWFSILLAASYRILGPEVGNAIFPVTLLGIAGILLAYRVASRGGSAAAGAVAGLGILALSDYRAWGRQVMTDVPAVALVLLAGAVYVGLRENRSGCAGGFALAGVVVAALALLRPVGAAAAVPFALLATRTARPGSTWARLVALFVPLVAAAGATMAYNRVAFGSAWRNGYELWCAVPYDYPHLLFSPAYLAANLRALQSSGLPILASAAVASLLVARRSSDSDGLAGKHAGDAGRALAEFLVVGIGPALLFHLFYFFPDRRFFLPATALSIVIVAVSVGPRLALLSTGKVAVAMTFVLAAVIVERVRTPDDPPTRRLAVEQIARLTPAGAVVLSAIEPPYVEYLADAGGHRRIVPISRGVEYASKLLVWHKVEHLHPSPTGWKDHRSPGLVAGGALEAVPLVATEMLDELVRTAVAGTPVFLDSSAVGDSDEEALREMDRRFRRIVVTSTLSRLVPDT